MRRPIEPRVRIVAARSTPPSQHFGIVLANEAGAVIGAGMLDVEERLGVRRAAKDNGGASHGNQETYQLHLSIPVRMPTPYESIWPDANRTPVACAT